MCRFLREWFLVATDSVMRMLNLEYRRSCLEVSREVAWVCEFWLNYLVIQTTSLQPFSLVTSWLVSGLYNCPRGRIVRRNTLWGYFRVLVWWRSPSWDGADHGGRVSFLDCLVAWGQLYSFFWSGTAGPFPGQLPSPFFMPFFRLPVNCFPGGVPPFLGLYMNMLACANLFI